MPDTVVTQLGTPPLPRRLLHLLKLHYKIPVVLLLVSYRKSFGVMSPSLSSTLWSCHAAQPHLLHSFVFVICIVCGWRAGILVLKFLVVNMLHSSIAVRPCCTILLSYGRPCLTHHRGTILASTGCAYGLRSCWKSTKRPLQRLFVLRVHPVNAWHSPFLQSPGTSAKR